MVLGIVIAQLVGGQKVAGALASMRTWLETNNHITMFVRFGCLGLSALAKGLAIVT